MWEFDHKGGWVPKNWCFQIVVLEKTLESPLDSKEIKPVNPRENQPWIFVGRTDAEIEAPIFWPPDTKNWLIGKDSDAGQDWRQEEKGTTEDEMIGRHYWLDGHEFEQALGVGDGQGGLACCSPWGHKELNTTEWLKNSLEAEVHDRWGRLGGLPVSSLHGAPAPPVKSHSNFTHLYSPNLMHFSPGCIFTDSVAHPHPSIHTHWHSFSSIRKPGTADQSCPSARALAPGSVPCEGGNCCLTYLHYFKNPAQG